MPPVTRWTIRAAALNVLLGMILWNVAGAFQGQGASSLASALHAPSLHLLVVGGLTQMVFGVAWWLFPVRSKDRGRGHPALAWAAFGLLNVGCLSRVVGSLLVAYGNASAGRALLLVAAITLPTAALVFAAMLGGRLRGPASARARS